MDFINMYLGIRVIAFGLLGLAWLILIIYFLFGHWLENKINKLKRWRNRK